MTSAVALPAEEMRTTGDRRWQRFAIRRTGRLLVSLWVLVTASFLMIHLVPGDPVRAALGLTPRSPWSTPAARPLGLNDPLWLQYLHYLQDLFTGDLGDLDRLPAPGVAGDRPAAARHARARRPRLPARGRRSPCRSASPSRSPPRRPRGRRLELAFTSAAWCSPRSPTSCSGSASSTCSGSRSTGCRWPAESAFTSYILPVIALAIGPAAVLARILRVEMLSSLRADYVRTARAKRLPAWRVYLLHALPNALTATLTIAGLLLSRHGRRHRAGRERVRLAGPRQHHRAVDRRQGLPGRAGRSCSSTASACCWSTSSSTSRSRCSTRARRSGRADGRERPDASACRRALRTPLGRRRGRPARRSSCCSRSSRPILWSDRATRDRHARTSCRARRPQHWLGTDNLGRTSSTACWSPPGCRSGSRSRRPRSASACGLLLGTAPLIARPPRRTARHRGRQRRGRVPRRCCSRCSSR